MTYKDTHMCIGWRGALTEGGEAVVLELWINRGDLLDWLGPKALKSAGGQSRQASGAIIVKVVKQTSEHARK